MQIVLEQVEASVGELEVGGGVEEELRKKKRGEGARGLGDGGRRGGVFEGGRGTFARSSERSSDRATERATERPSNRATEDDHKSSSRRPFET